VALTFDTGANADGVRSILGTLAQYRAISVVNGAGFVPVGWTVDTLGWKGTSGGITTQTVVNRVLGGRRPGEIVLMHCGSNPDEHSSPDAAALPAMIQYLRTPGNCLLSRSSRTLNPAPDVLTSYARHTRASGPCAGPAARACAGGGPRGGPAPAIPADLAGHAAERDHGGRLRGPVRPDGAGPEHGERRHGRARRVLLILILLLLGGACLRSG
jgi:hypothetical protein